MENTQEHLKFHSSPHLYPNLSDENIDWLCENQKLEQIQFDQRPHDAIFQKLNERLFKNNPKVKLRLFNFLEYDTWADLIFLKYLNNVEHLLLESKDAKNLGNISFLNKLKTLILTCSDANISLNPLLELENLNSLSLTAKINDFKKIAQITSIEKLNVSSIKEKQLDVLLNLNNLKELDLGYGGIKDLSKLSKLKKLKKLELSALKSIENIDFISEMESLEQLSLVWLSKVKSIPDFSKCVNLKGIYIDVLNRLENIEKLPSAKNLERFVMYNSKKLNPENFMIFGAMKNLKYARIYCDSDWKSKEVFEILNRFGINQQN